MDSVESYRLLIADVYELAGTSRRTSEAIARDAGQSVARWHLLSVLSEPSTAATAARRLGLARQSVHRVLAELTNDGLVEQQPNPDHQTSPLMSLTAAGATTLAELIARGDAQRARLLQRSGIAAEELDSAREVIRALVATLDTEIA